MPERDAVLEIGTEEIPARFLPEAREQMRGLGERLLREERLDYRELLALGTPRRLVLYIKGVAPRQEGLIREVRGPARRIAFDEEGRPTKAAIGFARSQGLTPEELVVRREGEKGDYLYAIHREEGACAREVLARLFPRLIAGLSFPKSMRWGDREFRFVRPIRWILALVGGEAIEFDIDGLPAGNLTYGHRFIAEGPFEVGCAEDYLELLRKAYCIVDQEERSASIQRKVKGLAESEGGHAVMDEGLLQEVTDLVEYPTAFVGRFDEGLLTLPREVIITPMRWHQRYFPVEGPDGRLMPRFIAVRDGTEEGLEAVRRGNERVLRARLEDAKFFYQEDIKRPLPSRVEELRGVVFLEGLGSMYDKALRLQGLAATVGGILGMGSQEVELLRRAALLCKADLVTNMVREFTELQGVMGRIYTRGSGEPGAVCEAIFEHYLPRFAGDELPSTMVGAALAICDRVDTLVGCFDLGLAPSGSFDPYGLRRSGSGIVQIIAARELDLPLSVLVKGALAEYEKQGRSFEEPIMPSLEDFFLQRVRGFLQDRGVSYDVIDAAVALGVDDIVSTVKRAFALLEVRQEPEFLLAVTGYTRARNIAGSSPKGEVQRELLEEPAEVDLFEAYLSSKREVEEALARRDFRRALEVTARIASPIDRFFTEVLVMCEDEKLRANRLALLASIAQMIGGIAELSRIVV